MNEYEIIIEQVASVSELGHLKDKYPDLENVWIRINDEPSEHWHLISKSMKKCIKYMIPNNPVVFNF